MIPMEEDMAGNDGVPNVSSYDPVDNLFWMHRT